MMAEANSSEPCTITGARIFGRMVRSRMFAGPETERRAWLRQTRARAHQGLGPPIRAKKNTAN